MGGYCGFSSPVKAHMHDEPRHELERQSLADEWASLRDKQLAFKEAQENSSVGNERCTDCSVHVQCSVSGTSERLHSGTHSSG